MPSLSLLRLFRYGKNTIKVLHDRKWLLFISTSFSIYFMSDKKTNLYPKTMIEILLYEIDTKVFYFLSDSNKNLLVNGFKLLQFKIGRL